MELAGFDSRNPGIQRVIRSAGESAVVLNDVPVWMVFTPIEADLEFVGPRHVPQLRMSGDMNKVIPQVGMPYDITTVNFDGARSLTRTADYLFSNDQLQSLVAKGLYHNGFSMDSEKILGSAVAMPANADMVIVPPDIEDAPPLVSVEVDLPPVFEMTQANSGYDLAAELFPDYRGELLDKGALAEHDQPGVEQVGENQYGDLFAGEAVAEYDAELYDRGPGALAASDRERNTALEALRGRKLVSGDALAELAHGRDLDEPAEDAVFVGSLGGKFGKEASAFFQENIIAERERIIAEREERMGTTRQDPDSFSDLEGVDLDDLGDLDFDDEIPGLPEDTGEGEQSRDDSGVGYNPITETGMLDLDDPESAEQQMDNQREELDGANRQEAEADAELGTEREPDAQSAPELVSPETEGDYADESDSSLSEEEKARRRTETARRARRSRDAAAASVASPADGGNVTGGVSSAGSAVDGVSRSNRRRDLDGRISGEDESIQRDTERDTGPEMG